MLPQQATPHMAVLGASSAVRACVAVLTDGHAGNRRQALALAGALDAGTVIQTILQPRAPWRWASPRLLPGGAHGLGAGFAALLDRPPALAIGCGRQAALATRLLRERGTQTVQILDPRIDPHHWDVVVAPEHDRLQGANVVRLLGSLHPVDARWLAQAQGRFPAFGALARPRIALLVGGPSPHARFDRAVLEQCCDAIRTACARDGGSVLASTSRRSPVEWRQALRARLEGVPGSVWTGDAADSDNPYPGMLAWADRIVCTADSVNMLSEACATQVPVHGAGVDALHGRPRAFVDALLRSGRIRMLDEGFADFPVTPLRETARVADEVRRRLGLPASADERQADVG